MSTAFRAAALGILCALAGHLQAQVPADAWRVLERSDYSRYRNGAYLGHVYREARGSLVAAETGAEGRIYRGSFLVLEDTLRDMRSVARRIDRESKAALVLGPAGKTRFTEDGGYPSLRGLGLPSELPAPGGRWTATGERILDLGGDGGFVSMPFLAEYRMVGEGSYGGRPSIKLSAKFATRYREAGTGGNGGPGGPAASQTPKEATGSHELDLDFDAETRELLFVRDRFDETFTYFDGSTERRSGFTLIFYAGASPLDRPAAEKTLVAALSEAAAEAGRAAGSGSGAGSGSVQDNPRGTEPGAGSGSAPNAGSGAAEPKPSGGGDKAAPSGAADQATPPGAGPGPLIAGVDDSAFAETGIDIGSSPQGIVLSIRDLRFVADSDQVLPSELWRLDALASALRAIPDRRLLVEGHSAATGKSAGELELSVRRAKAVAEALGARGIEASRIAYRGYGSTRPIASNDTEEGRARNRRVEVTVLDY